MRVFDTYLYEVSKGTKPVALVTIETSKLEKAKEKLKKAKFDFVVQNIDSIKANIFFGNKECIDTLKTFLKPLNVLNPYEDFILGVILGYDIKQQCKRFLLKNNSSC